MESDIAYTETIITYIGLATIFIGIILFAILFYQAAVTSPQEKKPEAKKPPGKIKRVVTEIIKAFRGPSVNDKEEKIPPGCLNVLFKAILIALVIFLGIRIMLFGVVVQSFTSFTNKELVAELYCKELDVSSNSIKMILIEKHGADANRPQTFLLTGDRWFLRSDIITWKNGVNFLGLNTMYKLTRIGGEFVDIRNTAESKSKEYSLIPEEETSRWARFYRNSYNLPFIKTAHSNKISQYPEPGSIIRIYVTPSELTLDSE